MIPLLKLMPQVPATGMKMNTNSFRNPFKTNLCCSGRPSSGIQSFSVFKEGRSSAFLGERNLLPLSVADSEVLDGQFYQTGKLISFASPISPQGEFRQLWVVTKDSTINRYGSDLRNSA